MLARVTLSVLGYRIDNSFCEAFKKQRVIIFPHTSRCESILGCLALIATGNSHNVCFPVARQYMETPIIGNILQYFGGVKVVNGSGMTNSMIEYMKQNKHKLFVISPEGSLSAKEWKSGFFYIAKGINSPIYVGGIDFVNHVIKVNLDTEIEISQDDTYENKVEEIKNVFANCKIYPLYSGCSNPDVITPKEMKSHFIPLNRMFLIPFTLFLIIGLIYFSIKHLQYVE